MSKNIQKTLESEDENGESINDEETSTDPVQEG